MSSNTSKTILLLAANPKGTTPLRLDEEVREIDAGLQRARNRDQFVLEQKWAVRPRDIQRGMLDSKPSIVHFSGHGTGDEGLVFEDETGIASLVDGEALAGLFELFADQVECVVLNGCYSEVQASAIAQHVNYVIGMNKALGDRAAIEFAVGFFDALGAGRPVEFAYRFGCAAIRLAGIPEQLTPVLKKKPGIDEAIVKISSSSDQSVSTKEAASFASTAPIEVFFSYSHQDEQLRDELAKHLSILKRQGIITAWYDREISAGTEWAGEIDAHLNTAQVILLLISADFLASDYCYDIELTQAMERHAAQEARVIPVILREVDWKGAAFGKLQALPKNALPVNNWANRDQAFADIARGIRKAVEELKKVNGPRLPNGSEPVDRNEVQQGECSKKPNSPLPILGKPSQVPRDKPHEPTPKPQPSMKSDREEKPSQSISISGGQVSGQLGQAGRDLVQNQQNTQGSYEKQLTPNEVFELIAKIESLFSNSDLPEEQKKQALKHLDYAKDAVREKEPDKKTAATSLQKTIKVFKETNEVLGAGQGIWQKLEPIAKQLAPWLGIAAKSLM